MERKPVYNHEIVSELYLRYKKTKTRQVWRDIADYYNTNCLGPNDVPIGIEQLRNKYFSTKRGSGPQMIPDPGTLVSSPHDFSNVKLSDFQ